jgi:apolipoprotein D and lipocalin family protein
MKGLAFALALALAAGAAAAQTVSHTPSSRQWFQPMQLLAIDPDRLAGTWYEVARYPFGPQDGCRRTTATYTPQADGSLAVLNRCTRDGVVQEIAGVATPAGPGRLRVRLAGLPFVSDLRVLGMSRDGRTVYLGTFLRNAGWVLHRDRRFTEEERRVAAGLFRASGYDEAALQRTVQW